MSSSNERENERVLLLERIFPYAYASVENPPTLLKICKELGDEYCLKFEDTGFTKNYEKFENKQVVTRSAKLLTDDSLLAYCEKYKDRLNTYNDFKGQYYTYSHQTRKLKLESDWPKLEKKLQDMIMEHHKNLEAVLEAIWEVNIVHGIRWDNWWKIHTLAQKKGLGKGWIKIIEELDLICVINKRKGDISIPEETIKFWRHFLKKD